MSTAAAQPPTYPELALEVLEAQAIPAEARPADGRDDVVVKADTTLRGRPARALIPISARLADDNAVDGKLTRAGVELVEKLARRALGTIATEPPPAAAP